MGQRLKATIGAVLGAWVLWASVSIVALRAHSQAPVSPAPAPAPAPTQHLIGDFEPGRLLPTGAVQGDLPYMGASAWSRLAIGTNGQCVTSNGTVPGWGSCTGTANYQTVQSNGVSQTVRGKLNFLAPLSAADNSGNGSTDVSVAGLQFSAPPLAANWTNLGSTSTLVDDSAVGVPTLLVTPGTSDSIWKYNGWVSGTNTTWTVASQQSAAIGAGGNPGFGIVIRNSAVTSSNVGYVRMVFYFAGGTTLHLQIQGFTGSSVPGSAGTVYLDASGVPPLNGYLWERLIYNNGSGLITYQLSANGDDWVTSLTQTPFQVSPAPVIQVGVEPMSQASTLDICRVYSALAL
jgi:hypothetical protein